MTETPVDFDNVIVRLAENADEIEAAQKVRYQVFYDEHGAKPDEETAKTKIDKDDYDAYADHLVVVDRNDGTDKIVGTYRLLRQSKAEEYGQFYSDDEYDLSVLKNSDLSLLELGRSCVLPPYRVRHVLNHLWQHIADYITEHKIDVMMGCASLHGTNVEELSQALSFLHHANLAPEELRVKALPERYVDMNIIAEDELDRRKIFAELPPLVKGYIRLGAVIGEGAVIDEQFNTTDIFIIVQTHLVTDKYRKHYERKLNKTLHGSGEKEE
ncbi:MAG: GNAT family N-acyltransferase [Pseudomonadota bacterium]